MIESQPHRAERHIRFADFDQNMTIEDFDHANAETMLGDRHIPTSCNSPPQKLKGIIKNAGTKKTDGDKDYLGQGRDFDLGTHIDLASRTLEHALDDLSQHIQSVLAWTNIPNHFKT